MQMKYQGKSEYWYGIGENKTGKKYCRNCGQEPFQNLMIENPYTYEKEQWLPPFCPHCGADMYGNNKKHNDGWIRCEDRLPEITENGVSDMVLLCWSDGQRTVGAYQGNRTFVGQAWPMAKDCRVTVVAWMPLPDAYEGSDTE